MFTKGTLKKLVEAKDMDGSILRCICSDCWYRNSPVILLGFHYSLKVFTPLGGHLRSVRSPHDKPYTEFIHFCSDADHVRTIYAFPSLNARRRQYTASIHTCFGPRIKQKRSMTADAYLEENALESCIL